MRGFYNFQVNTLWLALACLALSVALPVGAAPAAVGSEKVEPTAPVVAPKRHPLVVLKQTEIRGRVFFLPDEGEGSAVASRQLTVAVYDHEGRKLLHKTVTDDEGLFTLPDLDAGIYQIRLGGLVMDLEVQARADDGKKPVAKSLLVFMPRDLEK